MQNSTRARCGLAALLAAAIPIGPPIVHAQDGGSARAVQATVVTSVGLDTVMLADTGTLSGPTDAREASQAMGAVGAIVSAQTLHASAIASDDQVASEASLAGLAVAIDGASVNASFVQARATSGQRGVRTSTIADLTINGVPITVTGAVNQTIAIPGGAVVINEQTGNLVNALHIVLDGIADVVVASARASAQ